MKIFDRMLRPSWRRQAGEQSAVIGGDSDLYLMALLQRSAGDLWILPDAMEAGGRGPPKVFSLRALESHWAQLQHVRGASSQAGSMDLDC